MVARASEYGARLKGTEIVQAQKRISRIGHELHTRLEISDRAGSSARVS